MNQAQSGDLEPVKGLPRTFMAEAGQRRSVQPERQLERCYALTPEAALCLVHEIAH